MLMTVTFNPALDITGVVDELIPNQKSYVHDEVHTPGGNGINAGIIAARLGSSVTLTGFAGGRNGEQLMDLIHEPRGKEDFIQISGETRINVTISLARTHEQTRLSFPGPQIRVGEWRELSTKVLSLKKGDLIILGGSLPRGVTSTQVAKLIRGLKKRGVRVFVDVPGKLLRDLVPASPDFIKPNIEEFQALTGSRASSIRAVLKLLPQLHKSVPLICVSSVEGGAILSDGREVVFGRTPMLKIRSSVGAGDSLVGAIAHQLHRDPKSPLEDLLRLGLAASSATLTEPALDLGKKKKIQGFQKKISIRHL